MSKGESVHPSSGAVKFVTGPTNTIPSVVKTDDGRYFAVHFAAGQIGFHLVPTGG